MATAPPPPPPPMSLPPSFGNQTKKNPPPHPAYAAVPYNSYSSLPIQETSPSPDPNQQGAAALSPDGPQSSFSQGEEENSYDLGNKCLPVQETDPAPQALNVPQVSTVQLPAEVQDEVAPQMNQCAEERLA